MEALDHREDQPQIAGDEPLPGRHVPGLGPPEQLQDLLVFQYLQLGGVDAADLYLSLIMKRKKRISTG